MRNSYSNKNRILLFLADSQRVDLSPVCMLKKLPEYNFSTLHDNSQGAVCQSESIDAPVRFTTLL